MVPLGSLELSSQGSANARDLGLVKVEAWAAAGISEGLPDRCATLSHTALHYHKPIETIFLWCNYCPYVQLSAAEVSYRNLGHQPWRHPG